MYAPSCPAVGMINPPASLTPAGALPIQVACYVAHVAQEVGSRERTVARATCVHVSAAPPTITYSRIAEYGSDPGFPLQVFPIMRKLKRWLAYAPLSTGLPADSSEKVGSSDSRR
jgi:hypothetical protein